MIATDVYQVDNKENYPMLLLSNFYVKANGLQTGKKKKKNVDNRNKNPG